MPTGSYGFGGRNNPCYTGEAVDVSIINIYHDLPYRYAVYARRPSMHPLRIIR
jgi:hypothetical protein